VIAALYRRGVRLVLWPAGALVAFLLVLTGLSLVAAQVMAGWGRAYASGDLDLLPPADTALVLGTLIEKPSGRLNPTLSNRLDAAAALWRAGKVRYLIVSGARKPIDYDEPAAMRDVLIARGVPAEIIYRDDGGIRTVASVLRARDIYGQQRLIVVSQRNHLDRALFLARHLGVEAWGYDALVSPTGPINSYRNLLATLYAYVDLVIGARRAVGRPVIIGVDLPN